MNKLSELSKPVFEIEVSGGHWLNCSSGKLTPDAGADFSDWPDGVNRLYSQEYVSAILAELEAKDKRIAELEQLPTIKHMRSVEESLIRATDMVSELEAKLATPVRLPDTRQSVSGERYQWSDGIFNYKQDAIAMLRAAGFTVEGGEQ